MVDQVKIGAFLKLLRKEKGITQEELAEMFGVSSRSVSRWENGNTLPDLGILVELSDYYDVDIREIIDGERKSEKMENETKETLLQVADYADSEKKQALNKKKVVTYIFGGLIIVLIAAITFLIIYFLSRFYNPQYNSNGISNYLCITIDESQQAKYIGKLDNYSIYIEKLKIDALYYTSVSGNNISLVDAVTNKLVSVENWRKKAWKIITDENTEILRYENYEIAVTDDNCIIRPITR